MFFCAFMIILNNIRNILADFNACLNFNECTKIKPFFYRLFPSLWILLRYFLYYVNQRRPRRLRKLDIRPADYLFCCLWWSSCMVFYCPSDRASIVAREVIFFKPGLKPSTSKLLHLKIT